MDFAPTYQPHDAESLFFHKFHLDDVGGPTANFRQPSCQKQLKAGLCKDGKKCLAPNPCKLLEVDHTEYLNLLRKIRDIKGVVENIAITPVALPYLPLYKGYKQVASYKGQVQYNTYKWILFQVWDKNPVPVLV